MEILLHAVGNEFAEWIIYNAHTGSVRGFQQAMDRRVNGRAVMERLGKLRCPPSGWELKVAPRYGPLVFAAKGVLASVYSDLSQWTTHALPPHLTVSVALASYRQ